MVVLSRAAGHPKLSYITGFGVNSNDPAVLCCASLYCRLNGVLTMVLRCIRALVSEPGMTAAVAALSWLLKRQWAADAEQAGPSHAGTMSSWALVSLKSMNHQQHTLRRELCVHAWLRLLWSQPPDAHADLDSEPCSLYLPRPLRPQVTNHICQSVTTARYQLGFVREVDARRRVFADAIFIGAHAALVWFERLH